MTEYRDLQDALFDRKQEFDSEVVLNPKLSQKQKDDLWDDLQAELAAKAHRLRLIEDGIAYNRTILESKEWRGI